MNQSTIDLCASFMALMTALVEMDGTGMSHDSAYDRFTCRIWLSRVLLWSLLLTSTYGILLTALERYVAVIYPFWYKVVSYIWCIYRVGTRLPVTGLAILTWSSWVELGRVGSGRIPGPCARPVQFEPVLDFLYALHLSQFVCSE